MSTELIQITQHELEEIHDLEHDVFQKQKRIDELKAGVKVLLINKMPVELGRFDAHLLKRFSRPVPWKKAVVDNLGIDFAEGFRSQYPPRMRVEVKVEEHAIPPLWRTGANSAPADAG